MAGLVPGSRTYFIGGVTPSHACQRRYFCAYGRHHSGGSSVLWSIVRPLFAYEGNVTNVADIGTEGYMIYVGYFGLMAGEKLNPYAAEPLYAQLAAILRSKIESGELAHLSPLPSEATLVQEYGVSRDTARRAVQALRDEGLVFTVPQRGTYVGPRPTT